ncbi:peptidoglycan-binding protein [Lysobacter hankyongensis]|uniref:Peptidoglycan DD-metalloendopeptidase family protein n=1 Tax=Lysobacter hankyongensis TaxID=1176535 RepID=A0ABP9C7D9_9GAMM
MAEHPEKSVQTANDYAAGTIGSLDDAWTRRLIASVVDTESYGGNLDAHNGYGYYGRYQAGAGWLVEAGLVDREKYQAALAASGFESEWDWGVDGGMKTFLNDPANWNNDLSLDKYLASAEMQDQAFQTVSSATYDTAVREGVLNADTPPNVVAGFLKARHLGGYEGAIDAAQGRGNVADDFGTTTGKYYDDIARNNDGFDQHFVPDFERTQTYLTIDPMRDRMLEHGEHGESVARLQQALNDAGIRDADGEPLQADGDFGGKTRDAVRQYQAQQGLDVDGKAGRDTLTALGIYDELRAMPAEVAPTEAAAPVDAAPVDAAPVEAAPVEAAPVEAAPVEAGGSNWPAPGNYVINTKDQPGEGGGEFGESRDGGKREHKGIDIVGEIGDPIEAFRPGEVIQVTEGHPDAGNYIVIDHGDGLTSRYLHLDTINVTVGQKVDENTVIGTMGRSGNTPDEGDTHLHFETRENGSAVDPRKYLDAPPRALLDHGDQGADVRRLQEALNAAGIRDEEGQPLKADGDFGDMTEDAVRKYQEREGLGVDGIAGADTLKSLGIYPGQEPVTAPPAEETSPQPPQEDAVPPSSESPPPQEDAGPPVPPQESPAPPVPPTADEAPVPDGQPPQEEAPPLPPTSESPAPPQDAPAPPVPPGVDEAPVLEGPPPQEEAPPVPPTSESPAPPQDSPAPPVPPKADEAPVLEGPPQRPPQEEAAPPSPPPAPEPLTGIYQDGDRGETVRKIQERLNERMGLDIPVDGIYGPLTEAAVTLYQHQNGLRVDGIAGPETLGKLNEPVRAAAASNIDASSESVPPSRTPPVEEMRKADASPEPQPNTPTQPNATIPASMTASEGVLQQGSTGPEVAKLQTMLNNQGFRGPDGQPIPTNGTFDAATTHALKAFEKENGMDPNGIAGPKTLEALSKAEQSPKLSNPNHPDNALYQQAMKGLEQMPAGTFKNAQERENAAATIAFEAKVSGLSQIDHVKAGGNNAGFFAVQGGLEDPTNKRVYVDREQAVQQTVQQSTQLMQQNTQNQPQAPAQDTTQQRENTQRGALLA